MTYFITSSICWLVLLVLDVPLSSALALLEPPDGKVLLSAWLDYSGDVTTGDRTWKFNERMGRNFSYFHFAVNLPIDADPPYDYVGESATSANVFLSVYPTRLNNIAEGDLFTLAGTAQALNKLGRSVIMRVGPDCNGAWYPYGQSPTQFIALFRRVSTAVRNATNATAIMWAPSAAKGYPFLGSQYSITNTSSDFALLDTNHNGQLDTYDDPFGPYYPGDQYVDWIGMGNMYHLGQVYPNVTNTLPTAGEFESSVISTDQPNSTFNFYRDYVAAKSKPFGIAETNAVFHNSPLIDVGPGEVAIKQAWWRQYMTNATFLSTYPKMKLINIFEFNKAGTGTEMNIFRHYTISYQGTVSSAWTTDFANIVSSYELASPAANVTLFGTLTSGGSSNAAGGSSPPLQALWAMLALPVILVVIWTALVIRRRQTAHPSPPPPREGPHLLMKYVPFFLRPLDKPPAPPIVGPAEVEAARTPRTYREYRARYMPRRESEDSMTYDGASQTGTGTYVNALTDEAGTPTIHRSSMPPLRQIDPTVSPTIADSIPGTSAAPYPESADPENYEYPRDYQQYNHATMVPNGGSHDMADNEQGHTAFRS